MPCGDLMKKIEKQLLSCFVIVCYILYFIIRRVSLIVSTIVCVASIGFMLDNAINVRFTLIDSLTRLCADW